MKIALATHTSDVIQPPPVALLSGTFEERLEKAARLGYAGVELMVARPSQLNPTLIQNQVKVAGLEIAAVASGPIFMLDGLTLLAEKEETSQLAVKRLGELIRLANQLSTPLVTIGSFRGRLSWAGGLPAKDRLVKILQSAADLAQAQGVRLVLEPLNRYETDLIRNSTEGLAFCSEVGREVFGLVLDTFHMNIEESNLPSAIRSSMAAGKLWHIHLGDSNRHPPGQGHIDFAGLVKTLIGCNYRGYLSAELLPLPDPDAAAAETIAFMRRLIPGG
jgi:sugar phosphate isomerase/epimerase